MLAIFSIFCCLAAVALGVLLEEDDYELGLQSRIAYDDLMFLNPAPTPVSRFYQLLCEDSVSSPLGIQPIKIG